MTLNFAHDTTNVNGTETNLFATIVENAKYTCTVFTSGMGALDIYIFRRYVFDSDNNQLVLFDTITLDGVQIPATLYFDEVTAQEFKITAQKLTGTNRSFSWLNCYET